MADLFGNRGFWQDSGCLSTEKKEDKTEDSDLVLICFQISVWSGTTTEQTSIEEGAEFMKRRRIIPGVMLKPFLDFRARAKALCQEMGEPYLNGFVMRRQDAAVAERALSVWRKEFCRRRDEVFVPMKTFLLRGSKASFLRVVRKKPFFLRRILFCVGSALSLMRLFWPPTARASEAQRMLFLTGWPSVLPMRPISSARRLRPPTSRKRLCVASGRFMNGYVHGAVLKPDLRLLPPHWKKRLRKAAGLMSGAETRSCLFSAWRTLGKHLRKRVQPTSRTRRKRPSFL